jgi:hypothetical protein
MWVALGGRGTSKVAGLVRTAQQKWTLPLLHSSPRRCPKALSAYCKSRIPFEAYSLLTIQRRSKPAIFYIVGCKLGQVGADAGSCRCDGASPCRRIMRERLEVQLMARRFSLRYPSKTLPIE